MGGLITFNSSLTRFILMLDIWLCQLLELHVNTLESTALYQLLVKMLRHVWGTNHTFLDHHDPSSNLCFLCRAMELWFELATKLAVEYNRREREDSADDLDEVGSPLRSLSTPSRSVKIVKEKVAVTPKRLRKNVSSVDSPFNQNPVNRLKKKLSMEAVELQSFKPRDEDGGGPLLSESTRQAPMQRRRVAKVHSHSSMEVVSTFGGVAMGGDNLPPVILEEEEQRVPVLYEVFQLSIEKFGSKFHPDTSISIVQWLFTLIHNCKVLDSMTDKKKLLSDLRELFKKLWRSLEAESSNVARSCVGLLLLCADYMATNLDEEEKQEEEDEEEEVEAEEEDGERVKSKEEVKLKKQRGKGAKKRRKEGIFSRSLKDGLTSHNWSIRFKTIEKLTSILQFMLSSDVVGVSYHDFHVKVKHTLAHSFCLLTHLLQDRNSNVCCRARYCLTSIKETSLEVTSDFLTSLFRENPSQRSLIFHTLSLLDSTLPELHFLNLDLLNRLMNITIQGTNIICKDTADLPATKKFSDSSLASGATILRGPTPKVSVSSSTCSLFEGVTEEATEAAYLSQQVLSLLLRHIGNPRANVRASMQKVQQSAPTPMKKGSTIKKLLIQPVGNPEEVFVSLLRHNIFEDLQCYPSELRKNLLLEVFLNHIFPVCERNDVL